MYNAFIFDMDGVLVDSEPLHYESEKYALSRVGLDFPKDLHRRFIGFANEMRFWEAVLAEFDSSAEPEELSKHKMEYFYSHLDSITVIRPAVRLLERIERANVTTALASSSGYRMIETILEKFSLAHCFTIVQSGEEVSFGKPHPDIFLKTAKLLGIPPVECIVFEDSLNGVKGGKAAGMTVIAVPNDYTKELDFSAADHVIGSLDEFDSLGLLTLPDLRIE